MDPVGAGASAYRTMANQKLLNDFDIAILRGNAHEVAALCGLPPEFSPDDLMENAQTLSMKNNTAIVISGELDIVMDNDLTKEFDRGSPIMSTITGTGCLLTAVIGAFYAAQKNRFDAASAATVFYGLCGEIAEKKAKGPGSFKMQFLDALYSIPTRSQYESVTL